MELKGAVSRSTGMIAAAILFAGALLRVPPLFHDFWLDEVWSYQLVQERVRSPLDVLTQLPIDNNHPLNSLWLSLAGPGQPWWVYRLPAWLAGVGMIALAGACLRRFGTLSALCSMLLVAASFPLVVYSTEARGYAPMLFCSLLALTSAVNWLETRSRIACIAFWGASVLGFLSHLTFLHSFAAISIFAAVELRQRPGDRTDSATGLLKLLGVPVVFLGLYYWTFISRMAIGGAEPASLVGTLIETSSAAVGFPATGPASLAGAVAAGALLWLGLRRLPSSPHWRLLFACGIVVVPLATLSWQFAGSELRPPLFMRYFLTSILLLQLLLGHLVAGLLVTGRWRRVCGGALLAVLLAGNLVHISRFIVGGRGQYRAAVEYLAEADDSAAIHVASNSDFRTMVLLSLYGRRLPAGRELTYAPRYAELGGEGVEWVILELLDSRDAAPPTLTLRSEQFALRRQFGFYGPSGCSWAIYQRQDPPDTRP